MEENYLLAKWLNNEMTAAELAIFMASEEYAQYEKIKKYSAQLIVEDFDEQKVLETVLKQKKKTPKVVLWNSNWYAKIAAVLVIALGVIFAINNFSTERQYANNGEKRTFLLPDNSEVVLNSGSEIKYKTRNWVTNRKLKLNGEAYFRVAKGKKFEITTELGKVFVLGTQFNVKSRKNRFEVICFEGRVKVNYNDKQIILTHGQAVTFENSKQTNTTVELDQPEWINNKISFEKENLDTVLDEIQRQYNITIKVKSNHSDVLFTGKIPTDNLDTTLQIIATTYNLSYRRTEPTKIIFEEK